MSYYHSLLDELINLAFFDLYGHRLKGINRGQIEHQQTSPENPKQVDEPFVPVLDLHINEDTNTVTATFELPGLVREDIKLVMQGNDLLVSGEKSFEEEVKEDEFVHRERQMGKFRGRLTLPIGTKVSIGLSTFSI